MADDELANRIAVRFIERRDVKAWQYEDRWEPDRTPVKREDLRAHLDGDRTMGHYLLSPDSNVRLFAFDVDLRKQAINEDTGEVWSPREVWADRTNPLRNELARHLNWMAEGLARRAHDLTGCHVAIALSGGKGVHVYCFTGSIPAAEARGLARLVLESSSSEFQPTRGDNFWQHAGWPTLEVETFPKQDSLSGKDLGNLMKLPLGVHRRTGIVGEFLRASEDRFRKMDPMLALGETLPWA